MMSHPDPAAVEAFAALHLPGKPLILYNIWDPGSAVAVAAAGANAIATGSWGVACAMGYKDGETLPLDYAIDNLKRIRGVTDLPVTIDMEAGYGNSAAEVGASVALAAEAGAAGINIEDKWPGPRTMMDTVEAALRIAAAAATGLFVNARCDLAILTPQENHDDALVDAMLERAKAYADSGARGLFAPFLKKPDLIAKLCAASPLPVNILLGEGVPSISELRNLGVARISHGHGPWAAAMDQLTKEARGVFAANR
jgi:2-methylisocitrate lyase-like PEP mutase family enzyme